MTDLVLNEDFWSCFSLNYGMWKKQDQGEVENAGLQAGVSENRTVKEGLPTPKKSLRPCQAYLPTYDRIVG